MSDPTAAPDQEAAHLEYAQLRAEHGRLQAELADLQREHWELLERCGRLRRLLVALLPPHAVYQEARALARALRERQPPAAAAAPPEEE